jgi:NADH-quinone oxidoreductase subunit L
LPTAIQFLFFAPCLSLLAFLLLLVGNKKASKNQLYAVVLSANLCNIAFLLPVAKQVLWETKNISYNFTWFEIGNFTVSGFILLDKTSAMLLLLTAFISFLVGLYSFAYMKDDLQKSRFFAFLQLFSAAMFGLLLTDNLLLIYIFWELVGLCSYLLIGFWHHKQAATKAAKKAFLLNRLGDMGFLAAIALLWAAFGSLSLSEIASQNQQFLDLENQQLIFYAGLGLVVAAAAKSAQLPFSTWLPDAMQAPTPASALLHAATMVAAGAYLLIRTEFLLLPQIHTILLILGAISSFWAALQACLQTEMKKILAFSTISQVGLLFLAIGLEATEAAFFHLLTHAFFKANLFLLVGLLATQQKEQEEKQVEKQVEKKQLSYWLLISYLISACALCGVPLTSGFLSKEQILLVLATKASTENTFLLYSLSILVGITLLLTVFYMTRQGFLLFGQYHKQNFSFSFYTTSKLTFIDKLPLFVVCLLACFSLFVPFSKQPFEATYFLQVIENQDKNIAWLVLFVSLFAIGIGFLLAYGLATNKIPLQAKQAILRGVSLLTAIENGKIEKLLTALLFTKQVANFENQQVNKTVDILGILGATSSFVLAWFDKTIVDGLLKLCISLLGSLANHLRQLQNGNLQFYIMVAILGLLVAWIGIFCLT